MEEIPPILYEIWDYESRNLIDAFESKEAALSAVRNAVERHGRAYVQAWALGRMDDDGLDEPLIEGFDLADLALRPVGT